MNNSIIPIIAGLTVGIALIVVMIFVSSSMNRYDVGGVTTSIHLPENGEFFTSGAGDVVVIVDADEEDMDSGHEQVQSLMFDNELKITNRENVE